MWVSCLTAGGLVESMNCVFFSLLFVMTYFFCYVLFTCRRRREYLQLDFEQLLQEKKIDSNLIMPRRLSSSDEHVNAPDSPVSPYLPLEVSLLQSLIADYYIPHSGVYFRLTLTWGYICVFHLDIWQWRVWLSDSRRLACLRQCWRITWSKTYSCKSFAAYRWQNSTEMFYITKERLPLCFLMVILFSLFWRGHKYITRGIQLAFSRSSSL